MSDLINLQPDDGSVDRLKPITFTVQGGDPSSFIGIWIRYEGEEDEILVNDGVDFLPPFAANSQKLRPLGDDTLVSFSVVPELGWLGNLALVRVDGFPLIVIP